MIIMMTMLIYLFAVIGFCEVLSCIVDYIANKTNKQIMKKEIEIQEVTPVIAETNVRVIYKERSYSKKELQEAWEASERNMRKQFSTSSYKGLTFDGWYNEDRLDNRMNIIGQNGNDGTHYEQ